MPRETVLETRGLSVRFGGVTALDGVDFRLTEGELRCLIGPNGAGKSTLFKCLTGQLRPTAGTIRIRGRDCTGRHPHWIARLGVGIKTQVPSVMDGLSVRENIWLAARRVGGRREADETAAHTMERLGIADLAATPAGALAHGQRQLVEFGIVLAGRPWLVLLDEPTAGMTGAEVERIVALIHEINRTATLVIVEHDMHVIRRIAETVTVFHQGRVLVEEDVEAVLSDPTVRDVYLGGRR